MEPKVPLFLEVSATRQRVRALLDCRRADIERRGACRDEPSACYEGDLTEKFVVLKIGHLVLARPNSHLVWALGDRLQLLGTTTISLDGLTVRCAFENDLFSWLTAPCENVELQFAGT